jgi:threonine synthase
MKIFKGFNEFAEIADPPQVRAFTAQATGCNLILLQESGNAGYPGLPPNTIAKSSHRQPADGYFAAGVIADTGGWSEDAMIRDRRTIKLLAETEGFLQRRRAEPLAVARKLTSRAHQTYGIES